MELASKQVCFITVGLLMSVALCLSCDPSDLVQGCRVEGVNHCVCGLGCNTTFVYATREQCLTASRGERGDPCSGARCLHGSYCTQTVSEPGYQCFCGGTGYYGRHCELRCPTMAEHRASGSPESYPTVCIVI